MSNMNESHEDARRMAETVVQRDRRRVRWLGVLSIGLWILSLLLIASVYLPIGGMLNQYSILLDKENPGAGKGVMREMSEPPGPPIPADQVPTVLARVQHEALIVSQIVAHVWVGGAIILAMALLTGLLASACSVALAITIRRTTLRQVSASLAEISEQLRLLREQRGAA